MDITKNINNWHPWNWMPLVFSDGSLSETPTKKVEYLWKILSEFRKTKETEDNPEKNMFRVLSKEEIAEAITEDRITPFLQPIVQVHWEWNEIKYEALMRIKEGDTYLSPASFLQLLDNSENRELYMMASKQMLRKSLKIASERWIKITVNFGAEEIKNQDFYKYFVSLIEEFEINPKDITIELLETISIEEIEEVEWQKEETLDTMFYEWWEKDLISEEKRVDTIFDLWIQAYKELWVNLAIDDLNPLEQNKNDNRMRTTMLSRYSNITKLDMKYTQKILKLFSWEWIEDKFMHIIEAIKEWGWDFMFLLTHDYLCCFKKSPELDDPILLLNDFYFLLMTSLKNKQELVFEWIETEEEVNLLKSVVLKYDVKVSFQWFGIAKPGLPKDVIEPDSVTALSSTYSM